MRMIFSFSDLIAIFLITIELKYNENNVPPAQLQKTPLNRKGIIELKFQTYLLLRLFVVS